MEQDRRYRTVESVAQQFDVDTRTVYRWRRQGAINGTKVGVRILFTKAEVARFEQARYGDLLEQTA
jgi:excisionase family DNA binding protein